jgi:hypothetical protein
MPAVTSAVMQANVPRVAGNTSQVPGYRPPMRRCYICGQDERACAKADKRGVPLKDEEGKLIADHTMMVVYPQRFPEFGKWFRGAGVNGVWYLSNGPSHKVPVPTSAVASIKAMVEGFEQDERDSERRRSGGNDLGKMAEPGTGESTNVRAPAQQGWR